MKKVQTRVQILVPALNVADKIDDTMKSIWEQNFDRENIYVVIVDFGSTDGTYEKILSYDSFHLGVYQIDRDFTQYRMASETARLANFVYPGGEYSYRMTLMPGDVIYPDYLSKMTETMYKYREYNISMILSEVDVKQENGLSIRKKSLYEQERIIDGKKEYMQYVSKGYQRNIMCFGGDIIVGSYRIFGGRNERTWWNKSLEANFERNAVYIPEHLGCLAERFYDDELQEILLRWESVLVFCRVYEGKFGKKLPEETSKENESNLAHYAMWRSFLMAERDDMRQAEACMLIAGVILPDVKLTKIYSDLERYIVLNDQSYYAQIKEFFDSDERA